MPLVHALDEENQPPVPDQGPGGFVLDGHTRYVSRREDGRNSMTQNTMLTQATLKKQTLKCEKPDSGSGFRRCPG